MSERSGDASQMPRVGRQKAARFLSDGSSVRGAAGGGGSSIVGISTAGIGTARRTPAPSATPRPLRNAWPTASAS